MYCMIHWISLHKRIAYSANKISDICIHCKLSLTLFYSQKEEKNQQTKHKKEK